MPYIQRGEAKIFYETWGRGPWVTLVNGHTRPLNDFRMMAKYLNEKGFACLALDNRGAGKSEIHQSFTLSEFCDDIFALWQECGIERTHLLGISMGGIIAQECALRFAEKVDRLALVSTATGVDAVTTSEQGWGDSLDSVKERLAKYFTARFAQRNEAIVKAMAKQIFKGITDGSFKKHSAWQLGAMRGYDSSKRLGELQQPTVIIHGSQDAVIPVSHAHDLAEGIATSELELIEGVGHLLLAEAPKELYGKVADFFLA